MQGRRLAHPSQCLLQGRAAFVSGFRRGYAGSNGRTRPNRIRRFCLVVVWRIVRPAHAANPLSGTGAARYGNRWNSVGHPVGYTSTSRSLAVLEVLVHVTRDDIPFDAALIPIDVPDRLVTEAETLPAHWSNSSHLAETRRV